MAARKLLPEEKDALASDGGRACVRLMESILAEDFESRVVNYTLEARDPQEFLALKHQLDGARRLLRSMKDYISRQKTKPTED